jgi:hypothetical protein
MNYMMNSSKIFLYESMKYNMGAQILTVMRMLAHSRVTFFFSNSQCFVNPDNSK